QEFKSDTESRRYVDLIQILALMLHRGYACSREQSLEKGRTRVSSARQWPRTRNCWKNQESNFDPATS
ncbi:hypothetical protein MCOR07_009189, partial [Pyricularia oryzae]